MTTYPQTWSTLDQSDEEPISAGQIAYFRQRFRNRIHEVILRRFLTEREKFGLTRIKLAKRLARRPEQITRWLSAPGNITLDTVSDLLLAMNAEVDPKVVNWSDDQTRLLSDLPCGLFSSTEFAASPRGTSRQASALGAIQTDILRVPKSRSSHQLIELTQRVVDHAPSFNRRSSSRGIDDDYPRTGSTSLAQDSRDTARNVPILGRTGLT